jgi:hypothetical protein
MECTRRASRQALQDLHQLQAETPVVHPIATPAVTNSAQTTCPQIGFVPATQPTPAPAAPPAPLPQTSLSPCRDLTGQGIMLVDGVLQPVPAGSRSFESFPVDR